MATRLFSPACLALLLAIGNANQVSLEIDAEGRSSLSLEIDAEGRSSLLTPVEPHAKLLGGSPSKKSAKVLARTHEATIQQAHGSQALGEQQPDNPVEQSGPAAVAVAAAASAKALASAAAAQAKAAAAEAAAAKAEAAAAKDAVARKEAAVAEEEKFKEEEAAKDRAAMAATEAAVEKQAAKAAADKEKLGYHKSKVAEKKVYMEQMVWVSAAVIVLVIGGGFGMYQNSKVQHEWLRQQQASAICHEG